VLKDTSLEEAAAIAQDILQAIRDLDVSYGGQRLGRVTASFGVTAFPLHGENGDALLELADEAMYEAKELGRDRVVVARSTGDVAKGRREVAEAPGDKDRNAA